MCDLKSEEYLFSSGVQPCQGILFREFQESLGMGISCGRKFTVRHVLLNRKLANGSQ